MYRPGVDYDDATAWLYKTTKKNNKNKIKFKKVSSS